MIELGPAFPGLGFRPARADDTEFAWTLYDSAMRERTEALMPWNSRTQHRIIADEIAGGESAIILLHGDPVGWMRLSEHPDRLFLHQIYLLESHRGSGIGTTVIRTILDAAAHRRQPLELSVIHSNPDARRLYRRLGFVEIRRTKTRSFLRRAPALPGTGPDGQAFPAR